jgi:hypothetical protein
MRAATVSILVGLLVCACSSGGTGGAGDSGANFDSGVTCGPGQLALMGPGPDTPHGYYGLANVALTSGAFSAMLPGGGSIELSWTGDATTDTVSVIGQLSIATGPTTMSPWCLASPSSLRIRGSVGTLDLRAIPEVEGVCDATNDAGSDYESIVGCFDVAS